MTKGAPAKQVERKCRVCMKVQQVTPRNGAVADTCVKCNQKRSTFNGSRAR